MISQEIMQLFLEINARGTTVIMATHNHNLVNKLRRRVVALVDGQIIKDEQTGTYAYE
jgi:cell division transport system ATP-binding protein